MSNSPALRISHIVYGRQTRGNKVTYLLDENGGESPRCTPETLVVRRWRKRMTIDGRHVFAGDRLSANVWRAVGVAFGTDANAICGLTESQLSAVIERSRDTLRQANFLRLPAAKTLLYLFQACGPSRLQRILDRHVTPDGEVVVGIPDLFLYAVDANTGRLAQACFVEVKKPREQVSPQQREEIAFLIGMGLKARVLRLIERGE